MVYDKFITYLIKFLVAAIIIELFLLASCAPVEVKPCEPETIIVEKVVENRKAIDSCEASLVMCNDEKDYIWQKYLSSPSEDCYCEPDPIY